MSRQDDLAELRRLIRLQITDVRRSKGREIHVHCLRVLREYLEHRAKMMRQ